MISNLIHYLENLWLASLSMAGLNEILEAASRLVGTECFKRDLICKDALAATAMWRSGRA